LKKRPTVVVAAIFVTSGSENKISLARVSDLVLITQHDGNRNPYYRVPTSHILPTHTPEIVGRVWGEGGIGQL